MVQINWTFQSIDDLREIANYIGRDSHKYAKLQVIRIRNKVEILKTQPKVGSLVQELPREDLRQLLQGNYRIIYKIISEERIDILTVHHSSRDLSQRDIL